MKKLGAVVALLLVLSLALCGCGSMKTAWIATRFGTAIKRTPVTAFAGELRGSVTGTALGVETRSGIYLELDSKLDTAERKSYTEIGGTVSLLGVDLAQNLQVYSLIENEKPTYYVHVEKPSLWTRGTAQLELNQFVDVDAAVVTALVNIAAQAAELNTVQVEGINCYRMTMVLNAEDIRSLAAAAGAKLPESLETVDLSGVTVPVELDITDGTFLPQRLELQVEGLTGPVLTAIAQAAGSELKGVELTAGELSLELTEFSTGAQTLPELPEEAVTGAAEMEKLQEILGKLFQK